MADPAIDPRYAAQFQRGFDPALHPPVERRGSLRIEVPRAAVQRVPDSPPRVDRAPVDRAPVERVPVERAPAEDGDAMPIEDSDAFPASRPRTEWAVLVVGVALLAVAGWLFWGSVEISTGFYQGFNNEFPDQVYVLAVQSLPGPLIVAGVAAVSFWIALRAVRLPKGDA